MRRFKSNRPRSTPILRMRHLPLIVVVVGALITGPLLVVWKQVYITKVSIKRAALSDSLNVLSKEAAQWRFLTEKLSSTSRIETIAHERLGLEYPSAGQITIIKGQELVRSDHDGASGFIAFLRRSFSRSRG